MESSQSLKSQNQNFSNNFPFNFGNLSSENSSKSTERSLLNRMAATNNLTSHSLANSSLQQVAHQNLDHFPYQNSLFNQEEAQFFNNFLNGFYEETPFDQDPIMFQQQDGLDMNNSHSSSAATTSNPDADNGTHQHQLKPLNLSSLDSQAQLPGQDSITSAVNAVMRNSMPFPEISKEYHHGMKLEDPRLQQAQKNNYAALNINPSHSSSVSNTNPSTAQVYHEDAKQRSGVEDFSPDTNSSSAVSADGPASSKKRGRPRKSASGTEKTKATKVAKITPPLAPLIVSNMQNNSDGAISSAVSSAAVSLSFLPTAQSGSVENYPATTDATTTKSLSKKGTGSKSATTPRWKELLTEEQKKTNHVLSEQRRRALIKDGFELLENLTPSLAGKPVSTGPGNTGGCHSKSAVLFAAAKYIQELQARVHELEMQSSSSHVFHQSQM